jgi:glutathione peroxidase
MNLKSLTMLLLTAAGLAAALPAAAANCPTLLDHSFQRLQDSAPQSLCQYQGKVLLVVNTASFCGFTGQYEGLEECLRQIQESRPGGGRLPVQRFR